MATSDSESDGDVAVSAKHDVQGLVSLLGSVTVLSENVFKKLNREVKQSIYTRLTEDAEIVKEFRMLHSSMKHIVGNAMTTIRKLGQKVERLETLIEEKDEEIEKIEETHAFVLNDLEKMCKIHREDKKLLLPIAFKSVYYTSQMSLSVGGDTKCSTCLQEFSEESILAELSCGHFFHKDCAIKWMTESKSACSLCNTHVTGKSASVFKKRRNQTAMDTSSATSATSTSAPSSSLGAAFVSSSSSAFSSSASASASSAFDFDES
jgi:hypothetical protein